MAFLGMSMNKLKIADYICRRIEKAGVTHTFGIPGDFILPFYAAQTKSALKTIVMTHEPSVGYAADAYARLRGLGVALVTYEPAASIWSIRWAWHMPKSRRYWL